MGGHRGPIGGSGVEHCQRQAKGRTVLRVVLVGGRGVVRAAGRVGVVGRVGPGLRRGTQAEAWVRRTCATQGLSPLVTDRTILGRVAALLGAVSLDAPNGGEPLGIEAVEAAHRRADGQVVEHSSDDGVLPGQSKRRPTHSKSARRVDEVVQG